MPLHSGEVFAGYVIQRLLGTGGMGEVYLAQHPRLPRQDALKILSLASTADREFRARFIREAESGSLLDPRNPSLNCRSSKHNHQFGHRPRHRFGHRPRRRLGHRPRHRHLVCAAAATVSAGGRGAK